MDLNMPSGWLHVDSDMPSITHFDTPSGYTLTLTCPAYCPYCFTHYINTSYSCSSYCYASACSLPTKHGYIRQHLTHLNFSPHLLSSPSLLTFTSPFHLAFSPHLHLHHHPTFHLTFHPSRLISRPVLCAPTQPSCKSEA
jgi:hypothetical protein